MTRETLYNIDPTGPLWEVDNIDNKNAKGRGKKNIRMNDSRDIAVPLFSKSVKMAEGGTDTVGLLHRELKFLEKLRDSGVTPKAHGIKEDSDGKGAHLLIEQLPGKSFEMLRKPTEQQLQHFEQAVVVILEAVAKIHQKGVFVVDINEGTFLLDDSGEPDAEFQVRVVDFELAVDENNLSSPGMQDHLKRWYPMRGDVGIAINSLDKDFNVSSDMARSAERFLSIKQTLNFFFGKKWEEFDRDLLNIKEYEEYLKEVADLTPELNELTRLNLSKLYAYKKKIVASSEAIGTENEYIKKNRGKIFQEFMDTATSHLIIPALLASKHITLSQECMDYIQKTLSPYLDHRPKYAWYNNGKKAHAA